MNNDFNNNQPEINGSNLNHSEISVNQNYAETSVNQSNAEASANQNNQYNVEASVNQSNQKSVETSANQNNQYNTETNLNLNNVSYNPGNIYSYTGSNIIQDTNQTNFNTNNFQYNNQTDYTIGNQSGNPYTVYPTPNTVNEEKPKAKKKRRFAPAAKLVAAALVFGLVAGGAFQAYYMLAWQDNTRLENVSTADQLQVEEVITNTDNEGFIPTAKSSSDKIVTDVSDVVANAMPSIVAINSTVKATTTDFFGREYEQEGQSSGSGIIIAQNDSNLLIVTNNHVVNGATSIQIIFSDEKTATATVKGADANADLAVLSVDMSLLSKKTISTIKVATLGDSDKMLPGNMVIAIGNALGYGQSVTVGYVSAVNRKVTMEDQTMTLLQTDAAINPGNSGGALLNTKGEVIGINSVKFASAEIEGMGYAIPISSAVPMINELMNREVVAANEQGFLGIDTSTAQEVTEVFAKRFNMPIGVYVNDVVADSPAEAAGLTQGDIITGLDGFKIETIEDLKNALSYKKAGQSVELTIQTVSGGAYTEKVLTVKLGDKQN